MAADPRRMLHGFAWIALFGAFLLILAGGLVTSRDAGLAVPDWPLAFGQIKAPQWWQVESIRTGLGHRILGLLVGAWTAVLMVAVLRVESDVLVRRLAIGAVGLVVLQALVGGLRILHLSVDLAMVHGVVGQLYFASLAAVVAVTSPAWQRGAQLPVSRRERAQSAILLAAVLAQLLFGLFIRHLGASARPLAGSPLLYAHVIGAGIVLSSLLDLQRDFGVAPGASFGKWLLPLVWLQIALGIATYVATDDVAVDRQATLLESWLPTLHVAAGATLLGAVVVRNMHAWRALLTTGRTAPRGALGRLL